jgi:hypothetical protein
MDNRQYVLYDGRARYDVDKAQVLTISDSKEEAMKDAEHYGDCVCLSYPIQGDRMVLPSRTEFYYSDADNPPFIHFT